LEIFMNATLADYFEELELTIVKPPASSPQPKSTFLAQMPRPERTDGARATGPSIHPLPPMQSSWLYSAPTCLAGIAAAIIFWL
jgi:hypothetical protein